jgi:N-acetylmuramoyl-L-alanine amidase
MLNANKIKYLIVHCSDTSDKEKKSAVDIHEMHLSFGWDGIGYHKIIDRSGKIENGRPEFWVGAHTYGLNNQSLGVCLIGQNAFTKKQFYSLEKVLISWKKKYPNVVIKGHSDAINTKKTCPNFNINKWCIERNLI